MTVKYCIALWSSGNTGKSSTLLSLITLFTTSNTGEYILVKFNDEPVNSSNRDSVLQKLWALIQNNIRHNRDGSELDYDCRCVFEDRHSKEENKRIAICTAGDEGDTTDSNIKYALDNEVFLLIIPTRTKGSSSDNVYNYSIANLIWKQISYCSIENSDTESSRKRLLNLFNSNKALNEAMQLKYMQEIIMR